jgi:hypothetical protein
MLSAGDLGVALCELSECEGIRVVAGVFDGGVFFADETGLLGDEGFLAFAFDLGRDVAAVFFGAAFEVFAFGLAAGFFFAVSPMPGMVCPSC